MTSAMVQEHLEWARQREHPVAEWKRLHDEEGLSYAKIANTIRILGATDLEPHARIAAKRAARPAPRLTA